MGDVLRGVLVTILVLALLRVLGIDVTGYFDSAVDWTTRALREFGEAVGRAVAG